MVQKLLALVTSLGLVATAHAVLYEGTWTNNTFNTSGPLLLDLQASADEVSINLDLDGPVFGGDDPPALSFTAPLDISGNGTFTTTGTPIGDLSGSFTGDGQVIIMISNVPGGFITEVEISGVFDLQLETFMGSYEIFSEFGSFATGDLEAHVHKAPVIQARKKSKVKADNTATVKARVTSNSLITGVTAELTRGNAKVRIAGTGPYRIKATRIKSRRTVILIKATNEDGETGERQIVLKK